MMPLLNQKPWFPTSLKPPDGVKDTDKVFHLRQTGEIFDSYESYLSRVRLLQSKQWSAGGKDGLNYEQALVEEQRAQELSNQVRPIASCTQQRGADAFSSTVR